MADAASYPLRKAGHSVPVRVLRDRDAWGRVPADLWAALVADPQLRWTLTEQILTEFWPASLHGAIREAVGLPEAGPTPGRPGAPRDPAFRQLVLRAYERRYAACGYDGRLGDDLVGLDAAHVRWHCYDGPSEADNGIALCSLHHTALDSGAIGLDPEGRILVSGDLSGGAATDQWLVGLSGRRILGPQRGCPPPARRHVAWHASQVFRHPARPT